MVKILRGNPFHAKEMNHPPREMNSLWNSTIDLPEDTEEVQMGDTSNRVNKTNFPSRSPVTSTHVEIKDMANLKVTDETTMTNLEVNKATIPEETKRVKATITKGTSRGTTMAGSRRQTSKEY